MHVCIVWVCIYSQFTFLLHHWALSISIYLPVCAFCYFAKRYNRFIMILLLLPFCHIVCDVMKMNEIFRPFEIPSKFWSIHEMGWNWPSSLSIEFEFQYQRSDDAVAQFSVYYKYQNISLAQSPSFYVEWVTTWKTTDHHGPGHSAEEKKTTLTHYCSGQPHNSNAQFVDSFILL